MPESAYHLSDFFHQAGVSAIISREGSIVGECFIFALDKGEFLAQRNCPLSMGDCLILEDKSSHVIVKLENDQLGLILHTK